MYTEWELLKISEKIKIGDKIQVADFEGKEAVMTLDSEKNKVIFLRSEYGDVKRFRTTSLEEIGGEKYIFGKSQKS